MRTALVLALILLASTLALADKSTASSKLQALLNMQAKASDAVDSALGVLQSLKDQNVEAQNRADEKNKTDEAYHGRIIGDLLGIADQNKAVGNAATEHRKHIESEIQITQEYLVWINNRKNEISRLKITYREHRCYANMMFIKSLKEHDEALEVVRWLREDMLGVINPNSAEELVDISQLQDSASKLKAYAHLFNNQALKAFEQLTQNEAHATDDEWSQDDAASHDNDQAGLQVQRMGAGTSERDVGNKLLAAVDRLEQHLIDSMRDLEKNEIQAAWDLSQWLQDTEAELIHLGEEYEAKTTYIDKLLIAIVGAKAREDEAWEIYFESASAYNDATAAREVVRAWFVQEKARRDEENRVLDEVIRIFKQQVGILDDGMRKKVDDFSVNDMFTDSDIKRSTDDIKDSYGGQYAGKTDSQARGL